MTILSDGAVNVQQLSHACVIRQDLVDLLMQEGSPLLQGLIICPHVHDCCPYATTVLLVESLE